MLVFDPMLKEHFSIWSNARALAKKLKITKVIIACGTQKIGENNCTRNCIEKAIALSKGKGKLDLVGDYNFQ